MTGGTVSLKRQTPTGAPDGMKLDADGNIYCTGRVDSRLRQRRIGLGVVLIPEKPTNLAWVMPIFTPCMSLPRPHCTASA